MNAYELADIIEDDMEDGFGMGFLKDAVSMIRQQADELNKVVQKLVKANGLIENLRIRIAELEKQTKPLSDEEIIKARQMVRAKSTNNWADTFAFARAIEERHGIK